jgi:ferrous iron transport protein B
LHGFSEDEQVVRHFLANNPLDLTIVLLNSSQIDRQLSLLLQIKKLNIPMVLALNMSDEAKKAGISIDTDQLAKSLNMPVLQISAKYGEGLPKALQAAAAVINQAQVSSDPAGISLALEEDQKIEKEMESLLARYVHIPSMLSDSTTDKIDKILLHKWLAAVFPSHVRAVSVHFCRRQTPARWPSVAAATLT